MDSLLSYLPPLEGLLPKWLFLVRITQKPKQLSLPLNPIN